MLIAKNVIYPRATQDKIKVTVTIGASDKITKPITLVKCVLDAPEYQAETAGLISLCSEGITTEITVEAET